MTRSARLEPSHELMLLAHHNDCDQSTEFIEAVNRARENGEDMDSPEIRSLAAQLVEKLVELAAIMLTEQDFLLEFVEVYQEDDEPLEEDESELEPY